MDEKRAEMIRREVLDLESMLADSPKTAPTTKSVDVVTASTSSAASSSATGDQASVTSATLRSPHYSVGVGEEMKSEPIEASPHLHGQRGALYSGSGTLLGETRMPTLLSLESQNNRRLVQLPRGGSLVETKYGSVQFGCPPNTLKDCMKLGITIPTCYIIPGRIFDTQSKIAAAEIEFPAYFNYFMLKKQVTFVATKSQAERLSQVLRETLVGPADIVSL